MNQSKNNQAILAYPLLWSLAIFFSDLFVFLTPLPIIYSMIKYPKDYFKKLLLPLFLIILGVYFLAIDPISTLYEKFNWTKFIISIPLVNYYPEFPKWLVSLTGISYLLILVFLARIIAYYFKLKKNPLLSLAIFAIIQSLVALVFIHLFFSVENLSIIDGFKAYYTEAINEFISQQEKVSNNLNELVFLEQNKPEILKYSLYLSPSMIIFGIFLINLLNFILSKRFVIPMIHKKFKLYPLNRWQFPFIGVWILIFSISLLLLNTYTFNSEILSFFGFNLLILMMMAYFLQGFNIVSFFLEKYKASPFLKMSAYALLILFFQAMGVFLISFGLFDSWFDFRKLNKKTKSKD
jgi:hypothetical protein